MLFRSSITGAGSSRRGGESIDPKTTMFFTVLTTVMLVIILAVIPLRRSSSWIGDDFPSNALNIAGALLFLLPVPFLVWHWIRIAQHRWMDFAGTSFFHRWSPKYRLYYFYCGAIYPELRSSQIICVLGVLYTAVLISYLCFSASS